MSYAETITLTSGKVIEGEIVERTDELIKVNTGTGVPISYYLDEIKNLDSKSSSTDLDVIPDKKQAIIKLMEIAKAEKNYHQMIDKQINQMIQILMIRMEQDIIESEGLSYGEQQQVRDIVNQFIKKFSLRFKKYLLEEMSFRILADEIFIPKFDKYFSVDEINEVIKYSKIPAIKKFNQLLPALQQESMVEFNRTFQSKLENTATPMFSEEFERIRPELEKFDIKIFESTNLQLQDKWKKLFSR